MIESKEYTVSSNQAVLSVADKLSKLAKLKEEGVITGEEFKQIKRDLTRKNR